jgi:hypothetical protein
MLTVHSKFSSCFSFHLCLRAQHKEQNIYIYIYINVPPRHSFWLWIKGASPDKFQTKFQDWGAFSLQFESLSAFSFYCSFFWLLFFQFSHWYRFRLNWEIQSVNIPLNITQQGDFFKFFCLFYALYSKLLHLLPLRFHDVSEDAGIDPRTVATSALAWSDALTARQDFIHTWLDLIHY